MTQIQTRSMSQGIDLEQGLVRSQTVAGALFFLFLLLHLSNILLAPLGAEVFNEYQRTVRALYQYPVIELVIVMIPIVVHAVAGVSLYFLRRGKKAVRSLRARLHTWAGVFLLLVIVGHVIAVRGPSFFYGVFPEFEGVSFSLWYFPAFFYPYYFLLAVAGFYHGSGGMMMLLRRFGILRMRQLPSPLIGLVAAAFLTSLLAFDGRLFEVPDQLEDDFGKLYAEILDLDINSPWK